jgi:prepilin-type processing-associated H-X9-DG protein
MLIGEGNGSFQVAWKFNSTAPAAVDATTTPNSIHDTGVTGATWEGAIVAPHLDTTNVLFADGHVKPLRLTNLLEASTSPPTTGTWATPTNRAGLRYFTRWSD